MAEHAQHNEGDHGHDEEHHAPPGVGKYVAVCIALMVLTLVSFGIANSPIMETRSIGWTGMMAVSCAKALLVILFFMHLKWEANWKYVLTVPATVMSVLIALALVLDIGCRTWHYSHERWTHSAENVNYAAETPGSLEAGHGGQASTSGEAADH